MLPSLGALSLEPTGAKDDVRTEMRAERGEMAVRDVFNKDGLVRDVLLALDQGIDSREVCELVTQWCSLNEERRAACDDHIWDDVGAHLWGKEALKIWEGIKPQRRFNAMCTAEYELRKGNRKLIDYEKYKDIKRFVLAAISGEGSYKTLSKASRRLRDDEEVVRAAIAKDARAIRYASPRLQALIDPLPPSEHWPRNEPTEFERLWGRDVLLIMLSIDWSNISRRAIRKRLAREHPEYDRAYWIAHKPELKVLVEDYLMPHIDEKIPTIGDDV